MPLSERANERQSSERANERVKSDNCSPLSTRWPQQQQHKQKPHYVWCDRHNAAVAAAAAAAAAAVEWRRRNRNGRN